MNLELSFLSKNRSLIGFDIQKSGILDRNNNDIPMFRNAIEVSVGALFVYLTIRVGIGKAVKIEDMIEKYTQIFEDKK